MKMKRVLSILSAVALTSLIFTFPIQAEPGYYDEPGYEDSEYGYYEENDEPDYYEGDEYTEDTAALEAERAAAQARSEALQAQLVELLFDMDLLQVQLIEVGQQVINTAGDLEVAEESREQQRKTMALRIRYMFEAGSASAIERILASGSIAEMLVQAEYVQTVHTHDRNMLEAYISTVQEIMELQAELEAEVAVLEVKQDEYKAQKDYLENLIEGQRAYIEDIDERIIEAARIVAEMNAQRAAAEEAARLAALAAAEEVANAEPEVPEDDTIFAEAPTQPDPPPPPPQPDPPPPPPPPADGEMTGPGGNPAVGQAIVAAAHTQLGVPYVWAGSTPCVGFDCSGLTMWAHAQVGISIPRVDICQRNAGRPVPMGQQMPGDIAWTPGHVGIYIGGGMMIEAPRPGLNVMIAAVRVTQFVRFW